MIFIARNQINSITDSKLAKKPATVKVCELQQDKLIDIIFEWL